MGDGSRAVQVEIFGQTYNLRGDENIAYLQELAAYVDAKMRQLSEGTRTADTLKLAILAALNIADEYFRIRNHAQGEDAGWSEKAGELVEMIDRCLEDEKHR
ncbi:MAG: cell division protein ZapA [Acidobacteriota bacterium]